MDSQTHPSSTGEPEDPPLSFEDLPDQAIGIILRKLEDGYDKICLTQASPSARRLTRGPNCEPRVMGETLRVETFVEETPDSEQAAYLGIDGDLFILSVNPSHPDFPLALDYLAARSKAFARFELHVRLETDRFEWWAPILDALYRQGACNPVMLRVENPTERPDEPESESDNVALAQALVSHWLAVSEGIHTPSDRSVAAIKLDDHYVEFLNGLRGIGELKVTTRSVGSRPLPELPHLADCLEKLDVVGQGYRPDLGSCNLRALREVAFAIPPKGAGFTDPPGSLHRFFASCANSLESVRLCVTWSDEMQPISLQPFAALPHLRELDFSVELLGVAATFAIFGTSFDFELVVAPTETAICLPSLEKLRLGFSTFDDLSFPTNDLLSRLAAPNLKVFEYDEVGTGVLESLDLTALSRFPSLEDVRVYCAFNTYSSSKQSVLFGDLSGLSGLRVFEVITAIDTLSERSPDAELKTTQYYEANPLKRPLVEVEGLPPHLEEVENTAYRVRWTAL